MDLFDYAKETRPDRSAPLADRMRPRSLSEFAGQAHIAGEGRLLDRSIKAGRLSSLILYGPPGTGKTTLARIVAGESGMDFRQLNATTSGIKDIREVIEAALDNMRLYRKKTLLFIDEIHRFNKSQQDALLKYVEDGTIVLIGATTENPYFEVNKALISRAMVLELKALEDGDIVKIVENAIADKENGYGDYNIELDRDALDFIAIASSGDARVALNALELAVSTTSLNDDGAIHITREVMQDCVQKRVMRYEKSGDEHYDTASALIKSIRGSDPDAALYWLGKMIYGGEDPKFIARRLIISASEDVGNADPNALNIAVSAFNAVNVIGMPEGRIVLAQAAAYLASAPKSNASYMAINKVMSDLEEKKSYPVPNHLRDAHYGGAKDMSRGAGYLYPHDYECGYVEQSYLPEEMGDTKYYEPKDIGYEKRIKDHLESLKRK